MLAPALCSLIFAESDLWVFLVSAAITSAIGLVLEKTMDTGKSVEELTRKDGFIIATICWFAVGMVGALPYMLFGVFSNPVDAIFESVSGFTTTGASVLTDIESLTHGMLFWRCFTQWLGGMGIIVLGVAILPRLGVGGMQLMALEGATLTTERISPRISEVAKNLWKTYLLISIIMAIALVLFGLPIYDSIVHMFSTISTGGYSSKNSSIGAYNNLGVEVTITVFMFIGGINFALLYGLLRKRFSKLIFDAELSFYFFVNVALIVVVAIELSLRSYPGFFHALRDSAFQVVSVSTGTGFSTVNYDGWPI
ncbi:MAG: TrkH family potassium uptake protein, partial [Candidatus Dadabacteria bacterium]|nr:TrkH family potassium uptake protein [Candidatus Dadabacteria bacterium]